MLVPNVFLKEEEEEEEEETDSSIECLSPIARSSIVKTNFFPL